MHDGKTLTKYWQPGEVHKPKSKANNLNIFHLNISYLKYDFEEFHTLLTTSGIEFDITGISESRLKRNKQ